MNKVLFPDGVEFYSDDLTTLQEYLNDDILRRWNQTYREPGIVADTVSDDVLKPTSTVAGTIDISAGGAYTPGGDYLYSTGGSITGLTTASMFATGTTYIVMQKVVVDSSTRTHQITGEDHATRRGTASGSTAFALSNSTGVLTEVVLGAIKEIDAGDNITIDSLTDQSTGRRILSMSNTEIPTRPAYATLVTGLDSENILYSFDKATGNGVSTAYVTVTWPNSWHEDGVLGYFVKLNEYDTNGASSPSGTTQTQFIRGSSALNGTTFYGLQPGTKWEAEVHAVSAGPVPIVGSGRTSSTITAGAVSTSTMPSVDSNQLHWGIELTWDITDSSATGITRYEVFADKSSTITGGTPNYSYLQWSGYSGRSQIFAEVGEKWYIRVRGVDGAGQVTSNERVFAVTYTGPVAPAIPRNLKLYSGYMQHTPKSIDDNLITSRTARERMSANPAFQQPSGPFLAATWGWEGAGGQWTSTTGDTRTFEVPVSMSLTNDSGTTEDLAGWYLVFESLSAEVYWHEITGNTASTVYCAPQSDYDYDGEDHSGTFYVTPGAKSYEVIIDVLSTPNLVTLPGQGGLIISDPGNKLPIVTDPWTGKEMSFEAVVRQQQSPTRMYYMLNPVLMGVTYGVKVRAVGTRGQTSDYCTQRIIVAGINDQLVMPEVQHRIAAGRVFLKWRNLSRAVGYEIAYTLDGSTPGFDDDESYQMYTVPPRLTIPVQAGDVLSAKIRAVDRAGQISSNEQSKLVEVGVPTGYYGLSAYNLGPITYETGTTPADDGLTEYLIDFPFSFTVRYMTILVYSSDLPTGDTIDFKIHPIGAPDAEDHIAIAWDQSMLGAMVRQAGTLSIQADGGATLRIDGTAATASKTLKLFAVAWYEQNDVTPPNIAENQIAGVNPQIIAVVNQSQEYTSGEGSQ